MKLRNKKTGQIGDLMGTERSCPYITIGIDFHDGNPRSFDYTSLAELNEEWEDYEPAEPLIKDEKIRKAIRVWAEAVGRKDLLVIKIGGRLEISDGSPHLIYISFHADEATLKSLDDRTYYTIEELCGEAE